MPRKPLPPPACLRAGKGNAFLRTRPIEVCLTPTQNRFLRPGRLKLGCGSFACVYTRRGDPGHVVKITQDPTDIRTLQLLRNDPRVVRLKSARRLIPPSTSRETKPIYAAVVEKVKPAPAWLREIASEFPTHDLGRHYDARADQGRRYRVDDEDRREMESNWCGSVGEDGLDRCLRVAGEMIDLHERSGRKGVRLVDIHEDNIGVDARGRWKVLDVGVSRSGQPQVRSLAGLRLRRLPRPRRKR